MAHNNRFIKIGYAFKARRTRQEKAEQQKQAKIEREIAATLESEIRQVMIAKAKFEENKDIKWDSHWLPEAKKVQKLSKEKKRIILERIRSINGK